VDIAARYGGDEFALVLIDADPAMAEQVGERIQECLKRETEDPQLSASIGIASYPADGRTGQELLEAADSAPLRAKERSMQKINDCGIKNFKPAPIPFQNNLTVQKSGAKLAHDVLGETMKGSELLLNALEEGYWKKAWHGPNLKQALKGVTAREAAWRPAPGRHNIWEEALHAAYWKYDVRRILEGGKRGSFVLKGSNFFSRPEKGRVTEAAWKADKGILENEHERLREAVKKAVKKGREQKVARLIYGVAFHDIYHAGQIRLLRRLQGAD